MTKARTHTETVARLRCLADKWLIPLGFGQWEYRVIAYKHDGKFPKAERPSKAMRRKGLAVNMSVRARWHYQQITIAVNMRQARRMADADLERCLVHELAHGLVCEMRERHGRRKHEERTVTNLSHVLMWVWDAGYTEAREKGQTA